MLAYTSHLLLGAAVSLGMWLVSVKLKTLSTAAASIFYLTIIGYLGMIFVQDWSWTSKLLTLSRDAFMLSGFSVLIMALRRVKILPYIVLVSFIVNHENITSYINTHTPLLNTSEENSTNQEASPLATLSEDAELLVQLKDKSDISDLDAIVEKYDLNIKRAFYPQKESSTSLDEYVVIDVPAKHLKDIAEINLEINKLQDVVWQEPNEVLKLDVLEGEPKTQKHNCNHVDDPLDPEQWMHHALEMDKYYGLLETLKSSTKKRARLFILDSGIDAKHEDIGKNYTSLKSQYDSDPNGHGTHCGGIAAAATNNGKGIASFAIDIDFIELSSIKVMNSLGFGSQKQIIDGIIEAVDNGADVISMSLGGPTNQKSQKAYNTAIQYAIDKNVIVIVAAGNSDLDAARYSPANAKGVIAVSAIDEELNKAAFSNTVDNLEYAIAAPGVNIMSTMPDNKYKALSGTSMACPHVAGLAAVLKSLNPKFTHKQIIDILVKSGKELDSGKSTGKLIQPYQAVKLTIRDMLI